MEVEESPDPPGEERVAVSRTPPLIVTSDANEDIQITFMHMPAPPEEGTVTPTPHLEEIQEIQQESLETTPRECTCTLAEPILCPELVGA